MSDPADTPTPLPTPWGDDANVHNKENENANVTEAAASREKNRRDWLRSVGLGAGLGMAAAGGGQSARGAEFPSAPEPKGFGPAQRSAKIDRENAREGTTDWQLTYTRTDAKGYRCPWIEGYVTRQSLRVGDVLDVRVSTNPPTPFRMDLYRMGYYQGKGARLVKSWDLMPGVTQPTPPVGEERIRECQWSSSISFKIPEDWVSGVYLGKLSAPEPRYESYVIFVLRDDGPSDLLFQVSDNTWNAYNRWPDDYSLYVNGRPDGRSLMPGVKTAFDRPYGKYVQIYENPLSQGSGEFLLWEFPLCYWLEQHGYDVSYVSNADTHARPERMASSRMLLSVGHDEYWSLEMYENVRKAIANGLNVAFLSGNTCCFVTPMTPNKAGVPQRVITRAGRYGGVSEEEKPYMGPFPVDGPNESALIGARTISPFNGSGDWVVSRPEHWLFEGTGMKAGDGVPGLVGWEFHGDPAAIPGLEIVAKGLTINTGGVRAEYTSTIYPGPKNNWVFNASTIFWAQGLSAPPGHMPPWSHYGRPHGPDPRVQRITANFLNRR